MLDTITLIISVVILPFLIWVVRSIFMLKGDMAKKLEQDDVQDLIDLNQRTQDAEIRILFSELQEIKAILKEIERDLRK